MNLNEIAKWRKRDRQKQEWESVLPDLKKAYLRLQLNPSKLPSLLKNYSPEYLAEWLASILEPPASPEKTKIRVLSDMVIAILYPDKKIEPIISEALPEIEKAYMVVLQDGGGWSAYESNPEKRKTAVMGWYRKNHARLSYLKETHLDDQILYEDGGGQEKRNFVTRLLLKIVKDKANKDLTFQKIGAHLKNLKKTEQLLPLEDL